MPSLMYTQEELDRARDEAATETYNRILDEGGVPFLTRPQIARLHTMRALHGLDTAACVQWQQDHEQVVAWETEARVLEQVHHAARALTRGALMTHIETELATARERLTYWRQRLTKEGHLDR